MRVARTVRRRGARRRRVDASRATRSPASTACCSPAATTSAPSRYGEDAHPTIVEAEPGRDAFEIALIARGARAAGLPILAICRGMQVLNVACGGTLVQDIPSQVPGALPHSLTVPPNQSYDARARSLDRQGHAARGAAGRPHERPRHVRGEQPPSSGGESRSRRAFASPPPRPTASSKRSKIRQLASASASSGIRKTSGAPASSARCSKDSSKPLPAAERHNRFDVRRVRKQIESADACRRRSPHRRVPAHRARASRRRTRRRQSAAREGG